MKTVSLRRFFYFSYDIALLFIMDKKSFLAYDNHG